MTEFDPKSTVSKGAAKIEDPIASLDGAKTSGDKISLLESILVEGKFGRSPFTGPQSVMNEASLSGNELVHHATVGIKSAEISVAQSLSPELKISLVERVVASRPSITVAETRAVCAVLDIDAKPFVDSLVKGKTDSMRQSIEASKDLKQFREVTLSLFYEDKGSLQAIQSVYQKRFGENFQTRALATFRDPSSQFALTLALFGMQQTPALDLERIHALIEYEKRMEKTLGGLFYGADRIHLEHAEQSLKKAKEFLQMLDREDSPFDPGDFTAFMKEATDSWKKYVDSKGFTAGHSSLVRTILMLALLTIGIVYAIPHEQQNRLWIGALLFCFLLHRVGRKREDNFRDALARTLQSPFITETEKRAHKKSSLRKSVL